MKEILKNKPLTFLLLVLTTLLIIMVSVLLVQFCQLTSFKKQVDEFNALRDQGAQEIENLNEFKQFQKTYDYINQRAGELGLIDQSSTQWIFNGGN